MELDASFWGGLTKLNRSPAYYQAILDNVYHALLQQISAGLQQDNSNVSCSKIVMIRIPQCEEDQEFGNLAGINTIAALKLAYAIKQVKERMESGVTDEDKLSDLHFLNKSLYYYLYTCETAEQASQFEKSTYKLLIDYTKMVLEELGKLQILEKDQAISMSFSP